MWPKGVEVGESEIGIMLLDDHFLMICRGLKRKGYMERHSSCREGA